MKTLKRTLVIGMIVMALGMFGFSVAAASEYDTPAEALAALTGRTEDSLTQEKIETGKTYGTLASEAGVLDEFRDEMFEIRKDRLDTKVTEGILTQEEADEITDRILENQADCDGTGQGPQYQKMAGVGGGLGNGVGNHYQKNGDDSGNGNGHKNGDGTGSCTGEGSCGLC